MNMRNDKGSGAGDGTTKRSFAGFDVRVTGMKKDNDAFDNFVNFDLAPKQINPRFEAIANSRHNLSLIRAKAKGYANSIVVNNSPTKIEKIEYKKNDLEPSSNKNKRVDSSSMI